MLSSAVASTAHSPFERVGARLPPGPAAAESIAPYAVLDDEQEWSFFSQPVRPRSDRWQSQLRVEGMRCAACALSVEQALSRVPGVLAVQVSGAARRATVVWSAAQTRPSIWFSAVEALGYRMAPDLDQRISQESKRAARRMLWRWLVAGFCMMQVMMYAYPAYVADAGSLSPDIEQLMRWASWVLSLPVLLFSAQPFWAGAWRDLRQRRISMDLPVALALLMTFLISSLVTFEPGGHWGQEVYFDSLTMFVFFLLSGHALELRLREWTAGSLDALMQRLPMSVERLQADGGFKAVAVSRLRSGDVVRVLPGQAFPGDGPLMEGATHVDESLISGESRPLLRSQGAAVLAGSYNLRAPVQMRIDRLGDQTRYGQIVTLMQRAAVDKPRLARLADRLARPFLWAVLILAAAAAFHAGFDDPARAVMAAVAVLIVTCPCALSLATPSAMLAAAGFLARQGLLLRRLQSLEAVASVTAVVFDKTGTLTEPGLQLRAVETAAQRSDWTAERALQIAAALARSSLHPVSRSLVACAERGALNIDADGLGLSQWQEVNGQGVQASWQRDGRSTPVLLKLGSASFCGLKPSSNAALEVFLSDTQGWVARFELEEVMRSGAAELMAQLQQRGLQVSLWSGDRPAAVAHLAERLGLSAGQVRSLCTPQDKLSQLQDLQAQGHQVMVLGDGLNDGPVMAQADVSVAVGASVPLTQAQADLVLPSGQLDRIAVLFDHSQRALRIVRQNLIWAAAYNALCIPLAWMGWLPAWAAGLGMALSSLLVVVNAARLARPAAACGRVKC